MAGYLWANAIRNRNRIFGDERSQEEAKKKRKEKNSYGTWLETRGDEGGKFLDKVPAKPEGRGGRMIGGFFFLYSTI